MLSMLRQLMIISVRCDFIIHASHLLGEVKADHLSCFQADPVFFLGQHDLLPLSGTHSAWTLHLPPFVITLLHALLDPATCRTYAATLREFISLVPGASLQQPALPQLVLIYVAALHTRGKRSPKLSALSFWHQCNSWANLMEHFLVKRAPIKVANLQVISILVRVPVSPHLLLIIVSCLGELGTGSYQ